MSGVDRVFDGQVFDGQDAQFFADGCAIGRGEPDDFSDLDPVGRALPRDELRAKRAAIATALVGLMVSGGIYGYHHLVMPEPAQLGRASLPEAPLDLGLPIEQAAPAASHPTPSEPRAAPPAPIEPDPPAAPVIVVEDVPDGEDPAVLSRRSLALLNRRDNVGAARFAARATALAPEDGLAWLVLGAARQEMQDRPGARSAYQSCVERGAPQLHVRECRALLRALR